MNLKEENRLRKLKNNCEFPCEEKKKTGMCDLDCYAFMVKHKFRYTGKGDFDND